MKITPFKVVLFNTFIALGMTGLAWVLFQIIFVTFFSIIILGVLFANGLDRL